MAILKFEVQADYEKLIKLRNEIDGLEKQLRDINRTASHDEFERLVNRLSATRQEFKALATEAANAGFVMQKDFSSKIDNATKTLSVLERQMENQKAKISQTEQELAKLGRAYDESVRRQKGGEDAKFEVFVKTQSALEKQREKLVQLATQHTTTATSVGQISEAYRQFLAEAGAGTQMATQMMGRLQGLAMSLTGVYGASSFIQNMVQVRGQFQQADTAIESMLGSAEKAKTLMGEVREYAKISPLEFSDVTGATQMMLGFNIEAEKVPKFISAIGDVSMGNGQKFNSLTLAFSQMSAAGKLMGQDLNQMINAGFNPLQQMAKTTGKSISELKEEMSKGAISAEMVQQAFIDVTSEGGKFYKMSEKGSQTINGQMSMLQDSMDAMYNEIGTKAEGFIIDAIGGATDLIGHYQEIGKTIGVVAAAFGTYKAAMLVSSAMDNSIEKGVLSVQMKELEKQINARQTQLGMKQTDFSIKADTKDINDPLQEALAIRQKELETIERERLARLKFAEADAAGYDDIIAKQRELNEYRQEMFRADRSDENNSLAEAFNGGDIESYDAIIAQIDARKQKEKELSDAVVTAKERMLKPYQEELDAAQEQVDVAQKLVDAALESRDAEEYQAASIELKTATERRDTAQTQLNTMQQNVNNATKARATASNEAHALSQNIDTSATARNATATKTLTLAEVMATAKKNVHTIATKAGAVAQVMYGNAIKQVTESLQTMKLALLTNPITAIATVAMTAASAFYMFADSADEVTDETKRFGESATKIINNVNGLVMTLKGVNSSSNTYKEALGELNQIMDDYGIKQIEEADGLDVINKKREEAIELIKQEGIERERANNIDKGVQEYNKISDTASKKFKSAVEDIKGEIGDNATAISHIMDNFVQENVNRMNGLKVGSTAWYREYSKLLDDAKKRLMDAGISEAEANEITQKSKLNSAFEKLYSTIRQGKQQLDSYTEMINNAAEAEHAAAEGSLTAGQKFAIFKRKIEGADGSVGTIYKNIRKLISDFNNSEIRFKIKLDGEVPAWMKNIKVDKLKLLAERFTQLGMEHKNGVYMGGRKWTRRELLQRGTDYANAANQAEQNISPNEDKKNKRNAVIAARKKLKNAKTVAARETAKSELDAANKAYKAANDGISLDAEDKAKRKNKNNKDADDRARQQAKYNELVARQKEEREQAVKDLAQSTADAEISAMADGNAKTLAQMKRDAEKKEFELQKEIDAFKRKKIEAAKALWEADPKNQAAIKKGASFDTSKVDTTPTSEEQKYVAAKRKANNAEYDKALADRKKAERKALNDFLKAYGTFGQKKLAITQDYEQRIAEAQTSGERMSLKAQMDKELRELAEAAGNKTNWEAVFSNLQNYSLEYLRTIKKKIQDEMKGVTDPLRAKALGDQLVKVDNAISGYKSPVSNYVGNPFSPKNVPEMQRYNELQRQHEQDKQTFKTAQLDYTTKQLKADSLKDEAAKALGIKAEDLDVNQLTDMQKDQLGDKFGEMTTAMQEAEVAQGAMTQAGGQAAASGAASGAAAGAAGAAAGPAMTEAIIKGVDKNVQSFAEASQYLWDKDSDMYKGVQKFAESSSYAVKGFESLKSGDFVGTVLNVGKAVSSLGESFGVWSNSNREEIEKENNKLIQSQEVLTASLDRLSKKIGEGSAVDSTKAYQEARDLLAQQENTQRQIMRNNARMYDGGHSLNYDFGDKFDGSYFQRRLSNYLGTWVGGLEEFLALDARTMEKLHDSAEGRGLLNELTQMILDAQDDGNYNGMASDIIQFISTFGEEAYNQLEDQWREYIAGISLSAFRDEFKSQLMDMNQDVDDFTDNFTQKLMQSVLNAQIEKRFGEEIEALYKEWGDAISGDNMIDTEELEKLRKKQEDMTQRMIDKRDYLADVMGYSDLVTRQQSASTNAAKTITDEQADEISGRLTAVNLAQYEAQSQLEQQTQSLLTMNVTLGELRAESGEMRSIADDTRDIISKSYLELVAIKENTGESNVYLKKIQSGIEDLKNKL